jgi:hypothetical protein
LLVYVTEPKGLFTNVLAQRVSEDESMRGQDPVPICTWTLQERQHSVLAQSEGEARHQGLFAAVSSRRTSHSELAICAGGCSVPICNTTQGERERGLRQREREKRRTLTEGKVVDTSKEAGQASVQVGRGRRKETLHQVQPHAI